MSELADCLTIHAYATRAKSLWRWGQRRGEAVAGSPEYLALTQGDTFAALAALTIAKGAGLSCQWAVSHPSALIRHQVVRDKLISHDEATHLLNSPDT